MKRSSNLIPDGALARLGIVRNGAELKPKIVHQVVEKAPAKSVILGPDGKPANAPTAEEVAAVGSIVYQLFKPWIDYGRTIAGPKHQRAFQAQLVQWLQTRDPKTINELRAHLLTKQGRLTKGGTKVAQKLFDMFLERKETKASAARAGIVPVERPNIVEA